MRRVITVLIAGVTCPSLAAPAVSGQAQTKAAGKTAPTSTAGEKVRAVPSADPAFTTRDVTIITTWFRNNRGNLPPGLAKREALSPGLEQQLQKKGKLPPGLAKKIQPMPVALEKQLVVLPAGYRRVVIGGNIVLMNPATSMVYDIVRNVLQ